MSSHSAHEVYKIKEKMGFTTGLLEQELHKLERNLAMMLYLGETVILTASDESHGQKSLIVSIESEKNEGKANVHP